MEKTEIQINDRIKLVKVDSMNWAVFEYREIESKGITKRGGEKDWIDSRHYFGSVVHALGYVSEYMNVDDGEKRTLKQAVKAVKESNEIFLNEVRKALEAHFMKRGC